MNKQDSTSALFSSYPRSMFSVWIRPAADARTRARRTAVAGIAVSLLAHVILLSISLHLNMNAAPGAQTTVQGPISVQLAGPVKPRPSSPPQPAQAPAKPPPTHERPSRKLLATKRPSPFHLPVPDTPAVTETPAPAPAPPMDMSDMINARRAQRQQQEEIAARENAAAAEAERAPTPEEIAKANIQRSLRGAAGRNDGTGGVFSITHLGVRSGTFIFRGWTPGQGRFPQQTFEVDAGPDGDVERAIVRRMIALIRTHYSGTFHWDSHRLGRVLVMSARPEDNAGLEDFLMQEFFQPDGRMRG